MGNEFDIIIRNQRRPISSRLKTLARPRRRKDDYGRRRLKNDIYINYYDRGAFADGSDVPLYVAPNVTDLELFTTGALPTSNPYHLVQPSSGAMQVNFFNNPCGAILDSMNYASAVNTALFASDPETWASLYQKIDDTLTGEYSLGYTGADGWVSGKGFKASSAEKNGDISITSLLHSMVFSTSGLSSNWPAVATPTKTTSKVTLTQSYSDPGVDFVLDASCDVFLTPAILFYWGFASFNEAGDGDPSTYSPAAFANNVAHPTAENWLLNAVYQPIPRTATINNSNWDSLLSTSTTGAFNENLPSASWWRSVATGVPGARCFYWQNNGSNGSQLSGLTSTGTGNFPTDSSSYAVHDPRQCYRPYIAIMHFLLPEGVCVAAIKKKDIWYYVWSTSDLDLQNALNHYGGFV
jgi:hypothetical protein